MQYVYAGAGYDFIVKLYLALNKNDQFVGTYGDASKLPDDEIVPRVEKWETDQTTWAINEDGMFKQFSEEDFETLLSEGELVEISDFWAIKGKTKVRGYTPVLYLGMKANKKPGDDFDAARQNSNLVEDAFTYASTGTDRATTSSWFVVSDSNGGILDLLYSINPDNAEHSWAYGKVVDSPSIIRKGRFNNELQEN